MKKNVYKILAATFAAALIAASPATTITSHAGGFNANAGEDTTYRGTMPDDYWESKAAGNSNSGSSTTTPSTSTTLPGTNTTVPNTNTTVPNVEDNSSSTSSSSNSSSSNSSSTGSASKGNAKTAIDITVCVKGGQKFRSVINTGHTVFQVYHCGISRVSFTVKDADGNTVSFDTVLLEQDDEDKLWYEDITFSEDVDTEDFTVTVTKGDATYLSTKLGVSGIKINGTLALSTVPETEAE